MPAMAYGFTGCTTPEFVPGGSIESLLPLGLPDRLVFLQRG